MFVGFINDILIYSRSNDVHADHLRIVLQVLKDQKIFAKFSKCVLWFRSVAFVGHIIFDKDIEVDPQKTDSVKSCLDLYPLRIFKVFVTIEDRLTFAPLLTLSERSNGFVIYFDAAGVVLRCETKQGLDPTLIEWKEAVLKKSVEAFFQGGDGVLQCQGHLCVPNVDDLREQILSEAYSS
ncbi:hypothetical protein MTR67_044173 [Solanum verrucosum]|uniref:Reverse transcriptase domain-containing protein n=1 Tax=Solanum verrucosum TaxID=315347 RepID=A0AAF0USW0_SOLVR|nr:hypothetical protein MTR67_044173 [Solanum verrucosum]